MTAPPRRRSSGGSRSLDRLFGAHARSFLEDRWPHSAFVHHGPLARLDHLEIPELEDVASLLRSRAYRRVRVWFYDAKRQFQHVLVDGEQALKLYRGGNVTVVIDVLKLAPIRAWLDQLARDLETPMLDVHCNAYASPRGIGTRSHVDYCEVILVQLSGKKRWEIAPSGRPFTSIDCFENDPVPLDWLGAHPTSVRPDPQRTEKHTLRPGSAMFLPRGTWHSSDTAEESFALTLTFNPATWAQLVAAYLTNSLRHAAAFREPAHGMLAARNSSRREAAGLKLRQVADAASAALEDLDSKRCLAAAIGPYSVMPPVRLSVAKGVRLDGSVLHVQPARGARWELTLEEPTVRVWRAIERVRVQEETFEPADLVLEGMSPRMLGTQLQALLEHRALRLAPGRDDVARAVRPRPRHERQQRR